MTLQRWRWSNHFLNTATSLVLNGGADSARCVAAFARHFQEHISIVLSKTKVTYNIHMIWPNSMNCISRMNTHPWSFEEVIPCSCLDEKYKKVKSITKMGICCNQLCSLSQYLVERKKMLYCTDAVMQIIAPQNAKRLIGQSTRNFVEHKKFCE